MKERGIIMGAPMVRALLDGSKTQTRRLAASKGYGGNEFLGKSDSCKRRVYNFKRAHDLEAMIKECPYGVVGDRLWVRETWHGGDTLQAQGYVSYRADGEFMPGSKEKWRPSIFMPRWASRITLEITGVRVERLQDISEEDAKAEGVEVLKPGFYKAYGCKEGFTTTAKRSYEQLWDSLHGKGAWELNPWVWVLEFKRI